MSAKKGTGRESPCGCFHEGWEAEDGVVDMEAWGRMGSSWVRSRRRLASSGVTEAVFPAAGQSLRRTTAMYSA